MGYKNNSTVHWLNWVDDNNLNHRIQIWDTNTLVVYTNTNSHKMIWIFLLTLPLTLQAKKQVSGVGGSDWRGKREGRSTRRKGGKWVSLFILLSLIPQGPTNRQELSPNPPTDVRAHCLFQSWQPKKEAQQATSRALCLIPSSLCLLGALRVSPQTASKIKNKCGKHAPTNN